MYDSMEGVLDLCNGAVSEKFPQIFLPPLPAKVFSGSYPYVYVYVSHSTVVLCI